MKQTERCEAIVGDRVCYTPLRYDFDQIGRVRAVCPACAGDSPRPRVRPDPVPMEPPRPSKPAPVKVTPALSKALADMTQALGAKAAAAHFGVRYNLAVVHRANHYGRTARYLKGPK